MKQYLAFDLGASSGRGILGTLKDGKLSLKEIHRFPNADSVERRIVIRLNGATVFYSIFRICRGQVRVQ